MLQISTAKIKKIYDVNIDGHHYKVRKMGAGERLAVAQAYKRIDALSKKKQNTEAETNELMALSKEVFDTMISVFDDQQGGKVRDKFFNEADDVVIGEVMRQIYEMQNEGTEAISSSGSETSESPEQAK